MRSRLSPGPRPTVAALIVVGLSAAGALGVTAQEGSPGPAAAPLVISTWAKYVPPDLAAAVEDALGVPVDIRYHATNDEIAATLASADPGIDVAFVSGETAQALAADGLLAPIDHARVPNLANLYAEAGQLAYDPGNAWSVPYAWGTTGICYRTDLVATPPTSWRDLLAPAADVEGRTTLIDQPRWLLLPALKALGYSANTTDEGRLAEAKAVLAQARPTLLALDGDTFYLRLAAGEASMVQAWDGWCDYAIADEATGAQVGFVVPSEGSDLWADVMVVPAGSRDPAVAHAFIDHVLQPEVHAWVVDNVLYKVPNRAAMELVDPALLARFPNLAMTPAELTAQETLVDLGDAADRYAAIAAEIAAQ